MTNLPKVIDLYSGVGGLSLGVVKAGFDLVGAVEYEKRICDSHAKNFPSTNHLCQDINNLTGKSLIKSLSLNKDELGGLVGGPPCQGFSTIGKRNISDNRNQLFLKFFSLVHQIRPIFYLAENVPGILNSQYENIRQSAKKLVEKNYHFLDPIKISANDFGAATSRTRVFFIGIRKDFSNGNEISSAISSKIHIGTKVKDAMFNLPIDISDDWLDFSASWRTTNVDESNNYIRSINSLIDGIGDPSSINRFLKKNQVSGCFGTKHSKDVIDRYQNLKPGQQDSVSKSTKLNPEGFCPTLRAGTDNTRGSFQAVRPIHYLRPRVITPREAARLQGFPDWFQFHETKWHSFRQIGNSVCPVAAEKILSAIKATIKM